MGGHAGHDPAHPVLADAVVDELPGRVGDRLGRGVGHGHAGVAGQVGAAGHDPGDGLAGGVEAGLDGLPGGHGTVLGGEGGELRLPSGHAVTPLGRLPPGLVPVPGVVALLPLGPEGLAAGDAAAVEIEHVLGHPEALVGRKAEQLLGQADLLLGEGITVGLGRVGEMGGGIADVAPQDDEGRAVLVGLGPKEGGLEGVEVVGDLADVLHAPSVGGEAPCDVVGVGELGRAVDGDVVVVVDVDQPAQLQVAGQRGGLVGDPLLEAAVAGEHERVVVADLGGEGGAQPAFGDPHAHPVGHALAEGTGGHLDPGRVVELGVARGAAAPADGTRGGRRG